MQSFTGYPSHYFSASAGFGNGISIAQKQEYSQTAPTGFPEHGLNRMIGCGMIKAPNQRFTRCFMMAMWNPWKGCRRCSEGCLHCYIHKGDAKRNIRTSDVVKTKDFYKPVEKLKDGSYKMKSGMVYLCFSTDFLIEEADAWRGECWSMMRERQDCTFLFLTKRIERFMDCIPNDWADGYENVVVCCTIENQKNADKKLSVFQDLPIKHTCITAQPLIEPVDMRKYLDNIELVVVGGESDPDARPLDYAWVLDIRAQCIQKNVSFEFRQCGTHFIKDGKQYRLHTKDLCRQARLAGIDYRK